MARRPVATGGLALPCLEPAFEWIHAHPPLDGWAGREMRVYTQRVIQGWTPQRSVTFFRVASSQYPIRSKKRAYSPLTTHQSVIHWQKTPDSTAPLPPATAGPARC